MSAFFDGLWWWRAEFGGKSNPYVEAESYETPVASPDQANPSQSVAEMGHPQSNQLLELSSNDPALLPNFILDASQIPDWNWEEFNDQDFNWC